jgi:hypothetical protein
MSVMAGELWGLAEDSKWQYDGGEHYYDIVVVS